MTDDERRRAELVERLDTISRGAAVMCDLIAAGEREAARAMLWVFVVEVGAVVRELAPDIVEAVKLRQLLACSAPQLPRLAARGGDGGAAVSAELLTGREVAGMLRRSPQWFYRHRAVLHREHGFPPPISGLGGTLWSRAVVAAWISGGQSQKKRGANAGEQEEREARLAERARRIASRLD